MSAEASFTLSLFENDPPGVLVGLER